MNCSNSNLLEAINSECIASVSLSQAQALRFFKTDPDTYGAHDLFLGITVSNLRIIAKKYRHLELGLVEELLQSKYNEVRLLALLLMVQQYQKGSASDQALICELYLNNLRHVNNWNLVDSSAHHILGHYLWDKDRGTLKSLSNSDILWERRVSIVATWHFIRKGDLSTTFEIVETLLRDKHDLIHKAAGWMLREAGKRDEAQLIYFLEPRVVEMPRTMLRYAVEKLSAEHKGKLLSLVRK